MSGESDESNKADWENQLSANSHDNQEVFFLD